MLGSRRFTFSNEVQRSDRIVDPVTESPTIWLSLDHELPPFEIQKSPKTVLAGPVKSVAFGPEPRRKPRLLNVSQIDVANLRLRHGGRWPGKAGRDLVPEEPDGCNAAEQGRDRERHRHCTKLTAH